MLLFLKDVSYALQGCIYLIKNTVKTAVLHNNTCFFYLNIFKNLNAKLIFQSSVSHDPSNVLICCSKKGLTPVSHMLCLHR